MKQRLLFSKRVEPNGGRLNHGPQDAEHAAAVHTPSTGRSRKKTGMKHHVVLMFIPFTHVAIWSTRNRHRIRQDDCASIQQGCFSCRWPWCASCPPIVDFLSLQPCIARTSEALLPQERLGVRLRSSRRSVRFLVVSKKYQKESSLAVR